MLLYAVVIPWQVETVEYGWLRPRTLPRILAVIMGLGGVILLLRPGVQRLPDGLLWARAALFAGVLIVSLALMWQFGFVWVAPGMALAIMLLAGERRWFWLAAGAARNARADLVRCCDPAGTAAAVKWNLHA